MRRTPSLLALLGLLLAAGAANAQQATTSDQLEELRALATQPTSEDADREALVRFLEREDVAGAVEGHGLAIDAVIDRIQTLDADAVGELADRAREVEQADGDLVGGDRIVISTTTLLLIIIIILLVA